mmetsp:Transcript_18163/g.56341  ORF Transcript_18163/g.56341 Transcript_18163/m.56341 type:complete len:256 (-) Transcript_18163:706-1473(-)
MQRPSSIMPCLIRAVSSCTCSLARSEPLGLYQKHTLQKPGSQTISKTSLRFRSMPMKLSLLAICLSMRSPIFCVPSIFHVSHSLMLSGRRPHCRLFSPESIDTSYGCSWYRYEQSPPSFSASRMICSSLHSSTEHDCGMPPSLWKFHERLSASSTPSRMPRCRSDMSALEPQAPSTWNQAPTFLAAAWQARMGSTAPYTVEPAVALTKKGCLPAATHSSSSRSSSEGIMIPQSSTGTLITFSVPRPSSRPERSKQ